MFLAVFAKSFKKGFEVFRLAEFCQIVNFTLCCFSLVVWVNTLGELQVLGGNLRFLLLPYNFGAVVPLELARLALQLVLLHVRLRHGDLRIRLGCVVFRQIDRGVFKYVAGVTPTKYGRQLQGSRLERLWGVSTATQVPEGGS